ncbi:unnamed protein product [Heterobilharzia americana]|nr:unnamed protein product [Heterobilharzia americana]
MTLSQNVLLNLVQKSSSRCRQWKLLTVSCWVNDIQNALMLLTNLRQAKVSCNKNTCISVIFENSLL